MDFTPLTGELREVAPRITRKPVGTPPGKDNAWGWGVPYGDLVLEELRRLVPAATLVSVVQAFGEVMAAAFPLGLVSRFIARVS